MNLRMLQPGENARELSEAEVEVWVPVPFSPTRYWVSTLGRVCSDVAGRGLRVLSPVIEEGRYPAPGIYVKKGDKRPRTITLHRLVILAFEGPPTQADHTDVRHLDGNKHNARLYNLAYGTRSQNMKDLWDRLRTGLPVPKSPETNRTPNRTYFLNERAVKRGIKLFSAGRLSLEDLAVMWDCSRDVARRALVGTTWDHLDRDMLQIEHHLGRTGGKHHLSHLSDEVVGEALQLYTTEHWSGVRFGQHLGIMQVTAHQLLSGKTWRHIPRPTGFCYPWPDASFMNSRKGGAHHATNLSDDDVLEVLKEVASGKHKTWREVSDRLGGLKKGATFALLKGTSWQHIERPEGYEVALRKIIRSPLTPEQQEEIIQLILSGGQEAAVREQYGLSRDTWYRYRNKARERQKSILVAPRLL